MSIEEQLRKKNNGRLLTKEDLIKFTISRGKNPETIKKIKLNRDLMRQGKVILRNLKIGK